MSLFGLLFLRPYVSYYSLDLILLDGSPFCVLRFVRFGSYLPVCLCSLFCNLSIFLHAHFLGWIKKISCSFQGSEII